MSLIQDALTKTQVKVAAKPVTPAPQPQVQPQARPLQGLDAFDREVEKKIQQVQLQPVQPVKKSYLPLITLIVLGVVFTVAVSWWFFQKTQIQAEPVPAMVVDIQKSVFVSKPELAQPVLLPPVATPVEEPKPVLDHSKFVLSGIVWDGEEPYALINGRITRTGDQVEHKALVHRIEKEYVDLRHRGELVRLQIQR